MGFQYNKNSMTYNANDNDNNNDGSNCLHRYKGAPDYLVLNLLDLVVISKIVDD